MSIYKKKTAIYPGTFDPVTFGHLDIIKRATALVDSLIVGVAQQVPKNTLFTGAERRDMLIQELQNQQQISVELFNGLLIDFAKKHEALIIIRGLRAVSDFEYEFKMSWVNHKLEPSIETIFLTASDDTQFISSNFVKEIAHLGGEVEKFIPKYTNIALKKKIKTRS